MIRLLRAIKFVLLLTAMIAVASVAGAKTVYTPPLSDRTLDDLKVLYRKLIDAENVHDLAAVKSMLLASPVSLFISRTEPVSKGDWGGYWGTDSIVQHFGAL